LQVNTLAIYGVGLLGGSVGMAVRKRGLARRVVGIGRSVERLSRALEMGAIDEMTTDLEEGCAGADLVVLASPVSNIIGVLPRVAETCKPGAIVTDVGSTKATIVARAERVFPRDGGPLFVGSHPMAGGEQSGVLFASADLFENASCIVTPTAATDPGAVEQVERFWRALGGRVVRLDPERHDRIVSAVSHLPHLAAVGVLLTAAEIDEDAEMLSKIVAGGFRDTTRVAASPAGLWRDICLENRDVIAEGLDRLAECLHHLASDIRTGEAEAIFEKLRQAREFRKRLLP